MKLNLILIASLLATSAVAAPGLARDDVSAQYDRWEQRLRSRVDALHVYPRGAEKDAHGDVLVCFRIASDGKPADIALVQSSGQKIFDRAAIRLVSRLGRLGPFPSATGIDRITLKLSYGDGTSLAEGRHLAKADAQERASNEVRNRLIVSQSAKLADKR